ncbi:hypothetical protein KDW99_01545 [Marinomonas rhizomae]|uniref:hypothetical protein n=1 Tax=Marinomonas rhizomae TaxID=491948 RepID=UPI0021051F7E|nr:hypothetical protein [Marinomonas rhizomae]UTV99861.1 hypothetical protein KDW99_01545 [Marinomonas rhizomae]
MKFLPLILILFAPGLAFSNTSLNVENYFYDIVFLNGLPLSNEAYKYCLKEKKYLSDRDDSLCEVFEKLKNKEISLLFSKNEIRNTLKKSETIFSNYSNEDFSLHYVKSHTRSGESFEAFLDTASFMSIADITPNLISTTFDFFDPYKNKITANLALIDINTNISGMRNKIIVTQDRDVGVLGFDFIGQYDQFSFYSDGIAIQPEDITCTEKCVSYDADFDGENLHFFYPLNGRIERVSFETGSPISTVPFSLEDRCIAEEIDFSELEERGLDVGDEAKICKKDFEFGDYTMQSSVVTQTSREIDGEPLAVMGMNMINAFDHVTVDMSAGKIYFYSPE